MKSSQRAGNKNEQQEDAVLQEGELKNKHFLLRVRKLLTLSCLCSSVDKKNADFSVHTLIFFLALFSLFIERKKKEVLFSAISQETKKSYHLLIFFLLIRIENVMPAVWCVECRILIFYKLLY